MRWVRGPLKVIALTTVKAYYIIDNSIFNRDIKRVPVYKNIMHVLYALTEIIFSEVE